MRVAHLAIGIVALGLLGGGVLLLSDLHRSPATSGDGGAAPPGTSIIPPAPSAALPRPAVPSAAAPPAPRPPPPTRTDAGVRPDVRVMHLGGKEVYWMLDPRAVLGTEGLFVAVHDGAYPSREDKARVDQLVEKMITQMGRADPERPLAEAFPKPLGEELQRTIKAPVLIQLDGRLAVWIPQITLK